MGAKGEMMAQRFEAKVQQATAVFERLSEADWPNTPMDALNAKHAQEHAHCTKAETIALHKETAAAASALVRGLADDQLDRSGTVLAGAPAMSAGQVAGGLLCSHIDEHLGSIRATVGG
jgi:hypothetical protein